MLPLSLSDCFPLFSELPSPPFVADVLEFLAVVWTFYASLSPPFSSLSPLLVDRDLSGPTLPFALNQSPYCLGALCQSEVSGQCLSSCPILQHWKQKVRSLSYLIVTQNFPPSMLVIFPPHRRSFSSGRSTLILINFTWSAYPNLLSDSINFPKLFPSSFPTSSSIISNGSPQTWTQNRECEKSILDAVRPLLHLLSKKRLFRNSMGHFSRSIWVGILSQTWTAEHYVRHLQSTNRNPFSKPISEYFSAHVGFVVYSTKFCRKDSRNTLLTGLICSTLWY